MSRQASDRSAIAALAETQSQWMKLLQQYGVVCLDAMTGYGKTVQAAAFAEAHYPLSGRVSVFEAGWLARAQAFLQEQRRAKERALLILDDLQGLRDEQGQAALFSLLLPLRKELMLQKPPSLPPKYLSAVDKQLRRMAVLYPAYLAVPKQYGSLTDKETEVLRRMADRLHNTEIAKAMCVNLGTVKFHGSSILRKLETENRTVAVKIAQTEGLLS